MIQNDFEVLTGERESGLPNLPTGNPLFTIEIDTLPSWNEIIGENNPIKRSKIIKAERERGYRVGLAVAKALKIPLSMQKRESKTIRGSFREVCRYPVTELKLFCLLKVWRQAGIKDPAKGDRRRDIYNPAIKAIIDGLTDVGLWKDDNENYHTNLWLHYAGVAKTPKMEIKFYERNS